MSWYNAYRNGGDDSEPCGVEAQPEGLQAAPELLEVRPRSLVQLTDVQTGREDAGHCLRKRTGRDRKNIAYKTKIDLIPCINFYIDNEIT